MDSSLFQLNFSTENKEEWHIQPILYLISYGENSYKTFVGLTYVNIDEAMKIVRAITPYNSDAIISSLIFLKKDICIDDFESIGFNECENIVPQYWQNVLKDILFTDGFKDLIKDLLICRPSDGLLYEVCDLEDAYSIIKNLDNKVGTNSDHPF